MRSANELRKIIEPAVSALGYELVACQVEWQRNLMILRVYIDSENGVTLDSCAKVSRQIHLVLGVEDPLIGPFNLEVSSPGLDRPLYTLEHYRRFVGKKVKIRLRVPIEEQRNFEGFIQKVEDNEIFITREENKLLKLKIDEIERAHLVPEFPVKNKKLGKSKSKKK